MKREIDEADSAALDLASVCHALGVLPQAGGVLDQDIKYYRWLVAGLRAINKKEEHERKKVK